jgi:hypothetical protein
LVSAATGWSGASVGVGAIDGEVGTAESPDTD